MRLLKHLFFSLGLPTLLAACSPDTERQTTDFTVEGAISYADREYGPTGETGESGFTATVDKPVRYAQVEVVDEDNIILATTTSDDQGNYQLQGTGVGTPRLRVLAKGITPSGIEVEVRDLDGYLTAVSKSFEPAKDVDLDITIGSDVPVVGAFNILDVFLAAGEFAKAVSGETPEALIAFWEPGNLSGTYFCDLCSSLPGIFVLGGRLDQNATLYGDSDHFDDDVLWHEYGHFLEYNFGTLDSLGGYHALGSSDLDLRLAWSEGWSNFISGAIKGWLKENNYSTLSVDPTLPSSFYIDTSNDLADAYQGIAWDFGSDDPAYPARYASNELTVAKLLWDLKGSFDLESVWNSFTSLATATAPSSTETFWDGWHETDETLDETRAADLLNLFLARSIDYSEDTAEDPADDTAQTTRALYASDEAHTLFKAAKADEIDIIPFSVAGNSYYRIETFGLTNGADTKLRILSGDGNVILDDSAKALENDNYDNTTYYSDSLSESQSTNDGCTLASRIDLYASASGTLYAEVTRASNAPLSAGRYGGYQFSVTPYIPLAESDSPKCPAPTP